MQNNAKVIETSTYAVHQTILDLRTLNKPASEVSAFLLILSGLGDRKLSFLGSKAPSNYITLMASIPHGSGHLSASHTFPSLNSCWRALNSERAVSRPGAGSE